MKPKRAIIRVSRLPGKGRAWFVSHGLLALPSATKAAAMEEAADLANRHADAGGTAQVMIHDGKGRFQLEWTYPRSSDPRRTPG